MIDKRTFKKVVNAPFETKGFVKKGQSQYLDGEDVLVVFNLEKIEMFSKDQYVINIGFWLKTFGLSEFPPYNQCHLYYRVERLFPQYRELVLASCSLEESDQQLLADLSDFISGELIPFLQSCTKLTKLRELMSQGSLDGGLVRREAREILSN